MTFKVKIARAPVAVLLETFLTAVFVLAAGPQARAATGSPSGNPSSPQNAQSLTGATSPAANETAQRALHLLEYIAVDYGAAVDSGRVVNETEYREQLTFVAHIDEQLTALAGASDDELRAGLAALREAVEARADATMVAHRARTLGAEIRVRFRVQALPPRTPSLEHGRALYAEACATCHGPTGRGDGAMAGILDPAPTDFADRERMLALPLSAVFATITFGIDGTPMPSYAEAFDDADRYDLAFFVGSLAFDQDEVARGEALATRDSSALAGRVAGLGALVAQPADVLAGGDADGRALVAWARTHPEVLEASTVSLDILRQRLEQSWNAYLAGETGRAGELAVSAYLDGFEPVEPQIDAINGAARIAVETEFLSYRELLGRSDRAAAAAARERLLARIDEVENQLGSGELGPAAVFTATVTVLAREGFEAVLVVVALCGLLVRAQRREALRYVHTGWVTAVVAGAATWLAAKRMIAMSGAQRELIEGVSSLLASLILFYVSYWLIAKVSSTRWQAFLRTRIETALTRGSLWTLSFIAFIAVYRELFETILFIEAISSQAGPAGARAMALGSLTGLGALGVLALVAFRFGLRLPVRRFFVASSVLLYALAVVLAGQGVAAMQKAGRLPVTTLGSIRVDWLGIHPTLESLGLQAILLLAAAGAGVWVAIGRWRATQPAAAVEKPV